MEDINRAYETIPNHLKKNITGIYIIKLVCIVFTSIFIYEELPTFLVTKPIVTTTDTKPLSLKNIPEILVCANLAFQEDVLATNGYTGIRRYALGLMGPNVKNQFHFTGCNGNDSQYGSSLLEHISTSKTKKYVWAYDVENYRPLTYASIKLKSANYPYGKCIQVSHSNSSSLKNYLMIRKSPKIGNVNNTIIILLRDPVNSAHLFSNLFLNGRGQNGFKSTQEFEKV